MKDDLLQRATGALRDATRPLPDGMPQMLARLDATSRKKQASHALFRRRFRATALAIAATFVGVGAWAGATGKLAALAEGLTGGSRAHEPDSTIALAPSSAPTAAARGQSRALVPQGAAPDRAPIAPPIATPERTPSRSGTSNARPRSATPSKDALRAQDSSGHAASPAPASSSPEIEALYREAHRAHFAERDFARALGLWDRYLSEAGSRGRLVVEARYNRAIALAHLGRRAEAVAGLRPFEQGQYGEYRREEARALIASLAEP